MSLAIFQIAQIKLMEEQAMADSYQHNVYAEAHRQGFNQRRGGAYQRDAYSDRYGRANQGGRPYGNRSPGQYREGNRRRRVSEGNRGLKMQSCCWRRCGERLASSSSAREVTQRIVTWLGVN